MAVLKLCSSLQFACHMTRQNTDSAYTMPNTVAKQYSDIKCFNLCYYC